MKIIIETIPHSEQRYDTVGDWQFIGGDLVIKVSKLSADSLEEQFYYESLIGIHELIEALLCYAYYIPGEVVDEWDKNHLDSEDPGSIPLCPYYRQHLVASILEKFLADDLGVNWEDYEYAIENLRIDKLIQETKEIVKKIVENENK